MAVGEEQKLKILYILKILWEETDERHPMTAPKMAERIREYGIHCERKSIYPCLDALEEFGFDVVRTLNGAFMGDRLFETPELKLLVDAVQSSRFITKKKSVELINKLSTLAGQYDRKKLKGQVFVSNRVKSMNESVYYNIDTIQEGIAENVQLQFQYLTWSGDKQMVERHDGKIYVISPWSLVWERERYYLVGYQKSSGQLKHFRVDKMKHIKLLERKREGKDLFSKLDMNAYTTENFGMFQGRNETVTLSVTEDLAGVIIDRFGQDVWMHRENEEMLTAVVNVSVSNQFYGWVTAFAGKVRILSPDRVCEEYRELLQNCIDSTEYGIIRKE